MASRNREDADSPKTITIFGGSGTLGFETFKILWERRSNHHFKLLLRATKKNQQLFRPFIAKSNPDQLEIIWGDVTDFADVQAAVRNTDYVLDAVALISPTADYYPELSRKVNTDGIANIVRAIEEEPGGKSRIKFAYTGTVAQTGERRPPIHWGRVGDPMKPSMFDYYAVTKIAGERIVLESEIKNWVSLRLTGIMPSEYRGFLDRRDPLGFHMPLDTCLENVTARDAGLGLANVVDVSNDSEFWRGIYNMGGGPGMRIPALEYITKVFALFGISDFKQAVDRNWFATTNFHMQYFVDSFRLNDYLHYWRDTTESWLEQLSVSFPLHLKIARWLARKIPAIARMVARRTHASNRRLLESHRNGTLHWRKNQNHKRLDAFFGGCENYDALPDWDSPLPELHAGDETPVLLDHGYDESKPVLDLDDLRGAANFRGGSCQTQSFCGDLFSSISWKCALGHVFIAKPNTVLKGGHWCPQCEPPEWDYQKAAALNPFLNQVVRPFAHLIPRDPISMKDLDDIREADQQRVGR